MPRTSETLVTVLGSAYFQPIADLLERLLARKSPRSTRVQSGHDESGYSAAIIVLLVAMFESYTSRVRYIQKGKFHNNPKSGLDIALTVFPNLRHKKALQEVYVLRDMLMHGHLWEIEYEWGGPQPMVLRSANLHPGYGDSKFRNRVDFSTQRTKALGMSALPSRVDRRDVLKTFQTIWKTLLRFEKQNRSQCYVSHLYVRFKNSRVEFGELQNELRSSLKKKPSL